MKQDMYNCPVKLSNVAIKGGFFGDIIERVRINMIPYQWNALNDLVEGANPSYCMKNFKVAAEITKKGAKTKEEREEIGKFGGFVFQDSDFAKWIEAVGYSLSNHPDEELRKTADEAIDLVCSAQQEDGYMDTYYIINGLEKRFTNLKDNHELYVLGHMTEGAVAYYLSTGNDKLLNAVEKCIDCVCENIGPEEGKLHGYPGHEILEMALVRLFEVTDNKKYLNLAKYFIDERGKEPIYFEEETKREGNFDYWKDSHFGFGYYQAARPVREQDKAIGHAVRAAYLYSGMAATAKKLMDDSLFSACKTLWNDVTEKQMYITGGIGQSPYGESFTYDYDLPNDTVYAETCASIGLVFFARRMLEIEPDSKYADVMEKALYNTVISGMSLDGKSFFYVNPLEVYPMAAKYDHGKRHVKAIRQKWFGCACCPPNIARLVSSVGEYAYTQSDEALYAHLYMNSEVDYKNVKVKTQCDYPWSGDINIKFSSEESTYFSYAMRIPGWCKEYSIKLNGTKAEYTMQNGYAVIQRTFNNGDEIELCLEMPVEVMEANPMVREDTGKVALMRGPIVYCIEESDNGKDIHLILADVDSDFEIKYEKDLFSGVTTITSDGLKVKNNFGDEVLYRPVSKTEYEKIKLKWIPYYTFANRGEGEMLVWVRKKA